MKRLSAEYIIQTWHDITTGWPLGAQMFLQVRPGTDSDKTNGNEKI